jgi:hypothetical protein
MLLMSLPLAALANRLNQVRQRRIAIAEIHKLGGNTMECPLLETGPDWSSYCPGRLHDMLGDDFFQSYNYAELRGDNFQDQHLASLRAFPQLRNLY